MIIVPLRNLICLFGFIVFLPLMLITILFIYVEDGLPIIFKQNRLGLNKRKFIIYKLRTLKTETPQVGTHDVDNHFQLSCGKIIRKLKLDEFPQLINVIKGDLNLIGPRPGLDTQYELMEERVKRNVFKIKPGITGLSQVLGYDMSDPSALSEVDRIYIEQKSFYIDSLIFVSTFIKSMRKHLANKVEVKINIKL
jgi:O-antigen biosynthesis protein WbqP